MFLTQMMMSGAIATIGVTWRITAYGNRLSSTSLDCVNRIEMSDAGDRGDEQRGSGDRQGHEERRIERAPVLDERAQHEQRAGRDVVGDLVQAYHQLPRHEARGADDDRRQRRGGRPAEVDRARLAGRARGLECRGRPRSPRRSGSTEGCSITAAYAAVTRGSPRRAAPTPAGSSRCRASRCGTRSSRGDGASIGDVAGRASAARVITTMRVDR